jgi:S-DNA-T family DNA segregation ATPase FtsK/SpoIIIE
MLEKQLTQEITIINNTLSAFGVDAGTKPAWTTVAGSSFVAYGLRTGPAQRISDVQRLLPELSERLSAARRRPTPVRLREMPLALEVAHPSPAPLDWRNATMRIGGGRMVAGRIYGAASAHDLVIDLAQKPHVLVAGTTGSGKSTMLRMMLSSLAYNADPDALRLVLVDLKNEDLVPFATLPHVESAAWLADDARHVVTGVHVELQRRVLAGVGEWPRLVLVIDELAQLETTALDLLSSILAIGRSKRVHVIAATQHPAVRLIGDKANYSVRLVGQVMDAQTAALATGRKGSGAELLPGAGAFLYVDGSQIERLQAYNLNAEAVAGLVRVVREKWCESGASAPVRTGAPEVEVLPAPQTSVPAPVRTGVTFPLPRRAPTPAEAVEIRRMRAELGSLNQLIVAVYGSKSSDTHRWVSEALSQPEVAPILKLGAR